MSRKTIILALFAILAAGLMFTACSEKNDDEGGGNEKPQPENPVNKEDWQSVSASGGTIEKGDITLTFPSGTFSSDTEVAITEVNASTVASEGTLSKFYQVTLPASGTKKKFTISLKCGEAETNVDVVARMPGVNRHTGKVSNHNFFLDAEVVGNTVKASVPLMSGDGQETPYFTIGVVESAGGDNAAQTRAKGAYSYNVKWSLDIYRKYKKSGRKKEIEDYLDLQIPQAHRDLKKLKFELPTEDIRYILNESEFTGTSKDAWGFEVAPWYSKSEVHILLNARKFMEMVTANYPTDNVGQLDQTLVHETIHAIQDMVYDPRWFACKRYVQGGYGDPWAMMSEAIGSWSEHVTGDKRIAENSVLKDNVLAFMTEFMPHYWNSNTYMVNGYAMGLFIKYLASKTSDQNIVELFQYQRDGKTFYEAIKAFLAKHSLAFFTEKDYYTFAFKVLEGEIDSRTGIDAIGEYHLIRTAESVTSKDNVYNYGVKVHDYYMHSLTPPKVKDKVITISTTTTGTTNRVYYKSDGKLILLGTVEKDAPFTMDVEDFCKLYGAADVTKFNGGSLYVVSTRLKNYEYFNTLLDRISYVFTVTEETASELELKYSLEDKEENMNDIKVTNLVDIYCYVSLMMKEKKTSYTSRGGIFYKYWSATDADDPKPTFTQSGDILHVECNYSYNDDWGSEGFNKGAKTITFDIVGLSGDLSKCRVEKLQYSGNTVYGYPVDDKDYIDQTINLGGTLTDIVATQKDVYPQIKHIYLHFGGEGRTGYTVKDMFHKEVWRAKEEKDNRSYDYEYIGADDDEISLSISFDYENKK